jgi:hypothetical protein
MSTQVMSPERTPIEPDIEVEARRLLAEIDRRQLQMRLIGGMAIRLLARERVVPALERPIQDLDFVVSRRHRRGAEELLGAAGYSADEQFNAINGSRRLLYHDLEHGRQIDVFVGTFEMCHVLPLADRLTVRRDSLPAADLLMTKLQIVDLNEKDRSDLYTLLLTHEVRSGDDSSLDVERITELASNDWGLQHTFELNLERLRDGLAEQPLGSEDATTIAARIDELGSAMERAPKSRKWKLRARVGERRRWYQEPEEVDRGG